ncbi:MAG: hydrogenase formation protein HypD, partial [Deltaproteobacteria bacterium]
LKGKLRPDRCPLFGRVCTPIEPAGPCMVSSEGTCSAYFKYVQ